MIVSGSEIKVSVRNAIIMPKSKTSTSCRLQQYVLEFKDTFTSDGKILYCQPCGKAIKVEQRSQVTQHLSGNKHKVAALRQAKKQPLISEPVPSASIQPCRFSVYCEDLCRAFVSADIPISKVNEPQLKKFLTKYSNIDTPDESTLRRNYLPKCYEETLAHIRSICQNEKIWVSIDETSDSTGRKIGHVVVGVLKNDLENIQDFFPLDLPRTYCYESHDNSKIIQ